MCLSSIQFLSNELNTDRCVFILLTGVSLYYFFNKQVCLYSIFFIVIFYLSLITKLYVKAAINHQVIKYPIFIIYLWGKSNANCSQ